VISAVLGCAEQRTVRPDQLQPAVEAGRAHPQIDAVSRVGDERVGIRGVGQEGSGLTCSIGEDSLCAGDVNTQRQDKQYEGDAGGLAPQPHGAWEKPKRSPFGRRNGARQFRGCYFLKHCRVVNHVHCRFHLWASLFLAWRGRFMASDRGNRIEPRYGYAASSSAGSAEEGTGITAS